MADDNKAEVIIGAKIDAATTAVNQLTGKFGEFSSTVKSHLETVTAASVKVVGGIEAMTASAQKAATTDAEWNAIAERGRAIHAEAVAAIAAKTAALQRHKDHTNEVIARVQAQMTAEQQLASQRAMQQHLSEVSGAVGGVISTMRNLLSILGIGLSVNFFKNLIDGAIKSAEHLNEMNERTGISVPTLAALDVVAKNTGTSLDGMAVGLRRLGVYMVEHTDKLRAAGITAKTSEEALVQLADIFQKLPEGAERTALAISLFGRSGEAMIPMLSLGSAELQKMIDKGHELNPVTKEMAERADNFRDRMSDLNTQITFAWMEMSDKLIPTMKAVVEQFSAGFREGGLFAGTLRAIGAAWYGSDQQMSDRDITELVERRLSLEDQLAKEKKKNNTSAIAYYQHELDAVNANIVSVMAYRKVLAGGSETKPSSDLVMHADGTFGSASGDQKDAERRAALLRDKSKSKSGSKPADTSSAEASALMAEQRIMEEAYEWGRKFLEKEDKEKEKRRVEEQKAEEVALLERFRQAQEYATAITKVQRDEQLRRIADEKAVATQIVSPIASAISASIKGIITGTTTLGNAMRNMAQSILLSFVDMGVKMVAQWAINQLMMTAATTAGVAARTAAEQAGSAQSILTWALAAGKNIMSSAWEAMAGAYKAMVGIPFIGPVIAPVVAAGAFAAVAAMAGNLMSAEGGYDIPAGVNPVVQAHAREMILPEKQADVIRDMAKGGGGGGGMNVTIHAVDAAGIRKFFMENGSSISEALRRQARNFAPMGTT